MLEFVYEPIFTQLNKLAISQIPSFNLVNEQFRFHSNRNLIYELSLVNT